MEAASVMVKLLEDPDEAVRWLGAEVSASLSPPLLPVTVSLMCSLSLSLSRVSIGILSFLSLLLCVCLLMGTMVDVLAKLSAADVHPERD